MLIRSKQNAIFVRAVLALRGTGISVESGCEACMGVCFDEDFPAGAGLQFPQRDLWRLAGGYLSIRELHGSRWASRDNPWDCRKTICECPAAASRKPPAAGIPIVLVELLPEPARSGGSPGACRRDPAKGPPPIIRSLTVRTERLSGSPVDLAVVQSVFESLNEKGRPKPPVGYPSFYPGQLTALRVTEVPVAAALRPI